MKVTQGSVIVNLWQLYHAEWLSSTFWNMNKKHILFIPFKKKSFTLTVCFTHKHSLESLVFLQLKWQRLKRSMKNPLGLAYTEMYIVNNDMKYFKIALHLIQ